MKILVALKHVPDTETKIKIASDQRALDASDVKWITSPYDEYALEEAIRLKEAKGAEVIAVSVGDEKAKDVLRNALALGADRAVWLKRSTAVDALGTAETIANFARSISPELLLFGHKGYGMDNSAVGPMVAEFLGLPQANLVTKLEVLDGTFRAEREGDLGTEVVEGSLPAVITAQRGLNDPRYANLKGIMAAKKKTIEEADGEEAPAGTTLLAMKLPPARPEGRRIEGDVELQAQTLIRLLRDEAKVL